jgi:diguanylate cyclase (GGDEF)-like protein
MNKISSSVKIFISGVFLFNLLMTAIVAINMAYNHRQIERRGVKEISSLSDILEYNLETAVNSIDVTLAIVVSEIENANVNYFIPIEAMRRHITQIDSLLPEVLGLRITNSNGDIVYAVREPWEKGVVNISDREYFKYLRDNQKKELYISQPVIGKYSGKNLIMFARRINNPDGSFAGEIHAGMPVELVTDMLSKIHIGDQTAVSLWGEMSTLIARVNYDKNYEEVPDLTPSPELRNSIQNHEAIITYKTHDVIDGIYRHYYDRKIGRYPLYVSVGRSDTDLYAQWWQDVYHVIFLLIVFFILTVVTSVLVWRYWGRKRLRQGIESLFHTRLQAIVEKIGEATIITDNQGTIRHLNSCSEEMLKCNLSASKGNYIGHFIKISHDLLDETCQDPIQICLGANGYFSFPNTTIFKDNQGNELFLDCFVIPLHTSEEEISGLLWMFRNIQKQRELTLEISHKATHDTLTGILNRSAFDEQMTKLLQSMKEDTIHGLLYLDLDRFKIVNDTCGHTAGDKLLIEITKNIQTSIRDRDIFVRLGGDEFAIVLTFCKIDKIYEIAEKIRHQVDNYRFVYDKQIFHIGVSIGLVIIDHNWKNVTALLQAADTACYAAKNTGRNRVYNFNQDDVTLHSQRSDVKWVQKIDKALINDSFVLFWQKIQSIKEVLPEDSHLPKIGIKGEILLRLQSDTGELLSPGPIIEAAEKFYIATEIDKWVVKTLFSWLELHSIALEHVDMLSFNLSGQSIGDITFHNFLFEIVENIPINYHKLCIEITETAAITNSSHALQFLNKIRLYGFKTSLDDFGSGMSSFGYLKTLPFDFLKIDGQFVKGVDSDKIDLATVKSMCDIARAMGKKTVAEFVETESCEKTLVSIGADYTQGYYRHRPEPIDTLLDAIS